MSYIKALSLGWGIQSWTLAAMSALGELEPVDVALHSDTTIERQTVRRLGNVGCGAAGCPQDSGYCFL